MVLPYLPCNYSNLNLGDTRNAMVSSDYKVRFVAEYWQTKIRYEKLKNMCNKYEAGTLDFIPDCPLELLRKQQNAMGNYLGCLEMRAEYENIDIYGIPVFEDETDREEDLSGTW